jgi:xanthine dehydrogenase accessory factor
MTYSHPYDRDILAYCLKKPSAYIGMIGSNRKVEMTKKMFADSGIGTMEALEKVDMPMGIDIGAEDPEEIAISILAKLIEVKNRQVIESRSGISPLRSHRTVREPLDSYSSSCSITNVILHYG